MPHSTMTMFPIYLKGGLHTEGYVYYRCLLV